MFDIGTFPVVVFSSRKTFIWFLVNTTVTNTGKEHCVVFVADV